MFLGNGIWSYAHATRISVYIMNRQLTIELTSLDWIHFWNAIRLQGIALILIRNTSLRSDCYPSLNGNWSIRYGGKTLMVHGVAAVAVTAAAETAPKQTIKKSNRNNKSRKGNEKVANYLQLYSFWLWAEFGQHFPESSEELPIPIHEAIHWLEYYFIRNKSHQSHVSLFRCSVIFYSMSCRVGVGGWATTGG